MVEWVLSRAADILLALLLMALILWFALTQPVFSFADSVEPSLRVDRKMLESRLREVMAIQSEQADKKARFTVTADYLRARLSVVGSVEQLERGDGLRILRLKAGKGFKRKLFVGMHYVVTEKPILEVAETATSLIELVHAVAAADSVEMQLDLTVFLHQVDGLEQGLTDASIFHVEQVEQQAKEGDIGILFAPGLRVPDAVYATDQWRYFDYLLPATQDGLSVFGRFKDVLRLRDLKSKLHHYGLNSVNSLNIPVSFPGMGDSPMKYYWDRDLSVFLVRPDILINDKDFYGHANFISAWFGLLQKGL